MDAASCGELNPLQIKREASLSDFIKRGGALSFGIIPTNRNVMRELISPARFVEACGKNYKDLLKHALLTPACGLALTSIPECERIWSSLVEFKIELLEMLGN